MDLVFVPLKLSACNSYCLQSFTTAKVTLLAGVLNLESTVEIMRKFTFPATIPVLLDLVAENIPPFPDSAGAARWRACHRQFADAQLNRQGITAYGCAHFIFRDNPPLAISAIVKAYTGTVGRGQGDAIMNRFLSYSLEIINEERNRVVHLSENDPIEGDIFYCRKEN